MSWVWTKQSILLEHCTVIGNQIHEVTVPAINPLSQKSGVLLNSRDRYWFQLVRYFSKQTFLKHSQVFSSETSPGIKIILHGEGFFYKEYLCISQLK